MRDRCAEWGDTFDEWQDGVGRLVLAKRKDDRYAATVGGIVLSIPRQVAKTFLVVRIVVALCTLFPGMRVIWSAHRTRTSTNTFRTMQGLVRRKAMLPYVDPEKGIRTANGEQEITFRNGSVIMFGAREQGFGRGFDEIDVEVFDEAQILTEKALEDMVAATNQSRHPHGALLFFMGTPPRPVDPGEEFTNRRNRALSGESADMVYVEFSADEDADPDDRGQWARANPSFPVRTPLESMLRLRANLTSEDSWMREALGVWDPKLTNSVIDPESWRLAGDETSVARDRLALAVDVSPDRRRATVALAGQREDGSWHVEVDAHRDGVAWVVPWVTARVDRNNIRAVVVDARSPAATLLDDLKQSKVRVTTTSANDMAVACGRFFDGVMDGTVHHIAQPQLAIALGAAAKRDLESGWAWSRKSSASDITPVVGVTLALWGAQNSNVKRPARRRSTTDRRAVVL